jgi:glycosyltransferase involved in cell wall biosynthesis
MINVLHIGTDGEWRGGENQIFKLSAGLRSKGVTSFIAYPNDSQALPRFAKTFKSLPLPRDFKTAVSDIIRFARENNIQILNAHSSKAHKLALAAKKQLGPLFHLIVHRRVCDFPKYNPFRRAKYFDTRVEKIVAISKAVEKILISGGVPKEKIVLIHDGIELSDFQPQQKTGARMEWRKRLELDDNTIAIAVVAALTREKGHDDFLKALTLIKPELRFRAFIAGRGPLEEHLKTAVEKLGLSNRVHFLGFVDDVSGLMNALDIVVLPSYSEGLGTVLIEATAAGCAVIGSNDGGIPEFVRDRVTGLLFNTGDTNELAAQLTQLLNSADLRTRLQKAALKLAEESYSVEKMCSETFLLYKNILNLNGV